MKTAQCSRPDRRQLSAALADQRSRHLLSCLQDSPATVRDLAVALAATELGCARSAVTPSDRRQHRRQLDQHYLPRLTDAGLLDRSPDGFVRYVPATLERFDVRFPSLEEPANPTWAAAAAVLGRAYRYSLVAVLAERESVSLSRLADRLATTDGVTATPRELAIACHHIDLPKLASVDLLSYDADARTVRSGPAIETVL
ncbi:hypothetical protein EGH22_08270 [Halomicroarcula sp. F28]|uniref:DUF7344 domain-containing protein n=1 Tax=Haloarcula salinisoli TaxID=2487746 RepID=UPI001C72A537|nr:hypothetical protein [Halomicroarcula salinisoli]MBX0286318.1 hypothetical protein [Halomicroarcula salinisoli]